MVADFSVSPAPARPTGQVGLWLFLLRNGPVARSSTTRNDAVHPREFAPLGGDHTFIRARIRNIATVECQINYVPGKKTFSSLFLQVLLAKKINAIYRANFNISNKITRALKRVTRDSFQLCVQYVSSLIAENARDSTDQHCRIMRKWN